MTDAPKNLRVRFAPSPTGHLHVGGARTALFNWLFARHHGGAMVLRIEDTDAERSRPEYETNLIDDLLWLGIDWDEGPEKGGPHAPYRQSERREVYAREAARLVEAGLAYPCADDEQEEEATAVPGHAPATTSRRPPYRGPHVEFDAAQLIRGIRAGTSPALRFRVPEGKVQFEDRIRGHMEIDANTFSDIVLLRSNGLPTYNFACVVDDADMQITHVLRGEDHLYNTAKQVLLYQSLGYQPPEFAHLPLILDEDRSKLKKREGREGTYVDEYRAHGYPPEALVNFLALLGWSSPTQEEILDCERLIREFDLERVSKPGAIFDMQKLQWMAGEYVRALPLEVVAERALPVLRAAGLEVDRARALRWVQAFRSHIYRLDELPARVREVLEPGAPEAEALSALETPEARGLLSCIAKRLNAAEAQGGLDGAGFKKTLQECGREMNVKGRALFLPVRASLTGKQHGPELPLLFDVLGFDESRRRISAAAADRKS